MQYDPAELESRPRQCSGNRLSNLGAIHGCVAGRSSGNARLGAFLKARTPRIEPPFCFADLRLGCLGRAFLLPRSLLPELGQEHVETGDIDVDRGLKLRRDEGWAEFIT